MSRSVCRLMANTTSHLPRSMQNGVRQPLLRPFSQTCVRRADSDHQRPRPMPASFVESEPELEPEIEPESEPRPEAPAADLAAPTSKETQSNTTITPLKVATSNPMERLASVVNRQTSIANDVLARAQNKPTLAEKATQEQDGDNEVDYKKMEEPFHFHVYGHKHNTHITVTKPDRNAIISISAGQIGFKKSKRGTYDAAYQLCAYVMDKLNQSSWYKKMHKIEVVMRGFGSGREAASKVLLGSEGRLYRDKIVAISDATRLKFGGTRSPKPRRLG